MIDVWAKREERTMGSPLAVALARGAMAIDTAMILALGAHDIGSARHDDNVAVEAAAVVVGKTVAVTN